MSQKTFADVLGEEIRQGRQSELYDGQRAKLQAEYEVKEAERQAALKREADRQIEQLKQKGEWPGYERR